MTVATERSSVGPLIPVLNVAIPCDFPVHAIEELDVVLLNGDLAILNVDYTVTLNGGFTSAVVTPLAGLVAKANGNVIFVQRDVPALQSLTLQLNSRLPETAIERALDRLAMMAGDIKARLRRVELQALTPIIFEQLLAAAIAAIIAAQTSALSSIAALVETARQWAQKPYGQIVDGTSDGRSALHYSEVAHQYATEASMLAGLAGAIVYDFNLPGALVGDEDWNNPT